MNSHLIEELSEFNMKLATDAERVVEWTINEIDKAKAIEIRNKLWRLCDEINEFVESQTV